MSAFVLVREREGPGTPTAMRAATHALVEQSFADGQEFRIAGWRGAAYPSLNGTQPLLVRTDAANFALAFGTFFFEDETGPAALEALRATLRAGKSVWPLLGGAFCVVICDGGELQLITDPVGQYKVYRDRRWDVISSSFLAVLATSAERTPSVQGVYEYVFEGATFGEHTAVSEVCQVGAPSRIRLADPVRIGMADCEIPRKYSAVSRLRQVEDVGRQLDRRFSAIGKHFAGHVGAALSGGFDSRLIVAQLRRAGVVPDLHVYGPDGDADVKIAKLIAAGEKLRLEHVDKGARQSAHDCVRQQVVASNFLAFDGCPVEGIFDSGADLATRRERARPGRLALNGGGGEIFRNFFGLPDRSFSVQQLLLTFYSQFDPKCCTGAFRVHDYYESLGSALRNALGVQQPRRLSRPEIEAAYPFFRCRYWTGRNTSINLRFGHSLTPFLELDLILRAAEIPLRYKNYGAFEASLIERADPALARYMSVYGHPFNAPMPWHSRLGYMLEMARPPALRSLSFRIKRALRSPPVDTELTPASLEGVLDMRLPVMSGYFDASGIRDSLQLARIYTLEYLFAWRWRSTPERNWATDAT